MWKWTQKMNGGQKSLLLKMTIWHVLKSNKITIFNLLLWYRIHGPSVENKYILIIVADKRCGNTFQFFLKCPCLRCGPAVVMLIQAICHSEAKTQTFTSRKTILEPRKSQKIMCFVIHGHHQSILHIVVLKKQKLCQPVGWNWWSTMKQFFFFILKVQLLSMLKKKYCKK